ncbi:HNH endonuclease [Perilla frutescens var. hirtella]|nr:HNH endonuclease [Perilla frutescens var. hirtella]
MAQFTAGGGRLKSLVTGNGLSVGFGAFHRRCCRVKCFGGGVSISYSLSGDRKRKLTSTVYASKSPSSSSATSNAGEVFDEVLANDSEFAIDELSGFRGLVLDISYRPVNVVCWKRAICLEFMDKADVLEYYDQTINSPSGSFYIPAVLRVPHLLQVVKRRKVKSNLSRKNIFHRDNYTCQYCSSTENLTIDHVFPIARGGKWTWENLVAACSRCNSRKGQKTLEEANMKLLKVPKAPKDYDILAIPLTNHAIRMLKVRKGLPEEWKEYLSKPYAAP